MSKISKEEKNELGKALLKFKKSGLESYSDYLENQITDCDGKVGKEAYLKYLNKQLKRTSKRIAKADAKLGVVGKN